MSRILAVCAGTGCRQGREPQSCNCKPRLVAHPDLHRITLTELDLELPHDAARVIAPPPSPRRPADPMRRRRLTLAGATAAAAFICFGVLLLCASMQAHSETATVLVGRR